MSTTEETIKAEDTVNVEDSMTYNDLENKEEDIIQEAVSDDETLNSGGNQCNKDVCLTYNGMEI